MLRARQELIVERFNKKHNLKMWKHVLDVIQNAIVICNSTEILYYNEALLSLIEKFGKNTKNMIKDVIYIYCRLIKYLVIPKFPLKTAHVIYGALY